MKHLRLKQPELSCLPHLGTLPRAIFGARRVTNLPPPVQTKYVADITTNDGYLKIIKTKNFNSLMLGTSFKIYPPLYNKHFLPPCSLIISTLVLIIICKIFVNQLFLFCLYPNKPLVSQGVPTTPNTKNRLVCRDLSV